MSKGTCDCCGAEIVFAWTRNRRPMPLDAPAAEIPLLEDGTDARNVAAYKDGSGRMIARVLRKGEEPLGFERRYLSHFATCKAPQEHRKRKPGKWNSGQKPRQGSGQRRRPAPNLSATTQLELGTP